MSKLKTDITYLVAILLLVALGACGCAKNQAPRPSQAPKAEADDTATDDTVKHKVLSFNLEGLNEKGAKKWDITGQSAEAVSESKIKLDNIVANAYGEEAQATITADEGVYDKTKNNVRLEKNVKATIENTQSFAGDFVDFSGQMRGASKSNAETGSKAKKAKTVITCDGEVQFDYENNYAYFSKNVKVVTEDGTIDADKITVTLDAATRRINQIMAEGNVKIARGENVTYSEKATYIEREKKIVLTGAPKLVIYQEGGLEGSILGK